MNTAIFATTQSTGGGSAFKLLTRLINLDAPYFGSAIKELSLEPYFADETNSIPGGDSIFKMYCQKLEGLPTVTFSRTNGNLALKYLSCVCKGVDFRDLMTGWYPPSTKDEQALAMLKEFARELPNALQTIAKTLEKDDAFDLPALIVWVESRIQLLSTDSASLLALEKELADKREVRTHTADLGDAKALSVDHFWQLIDLIDSDSLVEGMDKNALDLLEDALKNRSVAEIKSFHNQLSNMLFALDTRAHYNAAGNPGTDGFLYVRCYVVAHGRDFYQKVLNNPEEMPGELDWCEGILYVASNAWAEVTEDEPSNFDKSCAEKSYETGSNPLFSLPMDGLELFKKMLTLYEKCNSYKDSGKYVLDNRPGQVGTFQTYFMRPSSFRFRWVEKRMLPTRTSIESVVWTDGQNFQIRIHNTGIKKADHFVDMILKTRAISQGSVHMVLELLTAKNLQISWTRMTDIKILADESINDVLCCHIQGTFLNPDDIDVWIDKNKFVLRRLRRRIVLTKQEAEFRNSIWQNVETIEKFENMLKMQGLPESEVQKILAREKNQEFHQPSVHHTTYDYLNVYVDESLDNSIFTEP